MSTFGGRSISPIRLTAVVWLTLWFGSSLDAQLSEFEATRFVPARTCAAMSVNMGAVMEKIDQQDPLVRKFLDAARESSGIEFARMSRLLVMMPVRNDGDSDLYMPVAILMQQSDEFDSAAFIQTNQLPDIFQFEIEKYKGLDIYVGTYQTPAGATEKGPSFFFPAANIVVQSDVNIIRQMIDGESEISDGKELVNNLDPNVEIHLLVNDGSALQQLDAGEGLMGLAAGLRHLEIVGSYDRDPPVQATIEMATNAHVVELTQLINTLRVAIPGMLAGWETELDKRAGETDNPLEAAGLQTCRDLIALGNTALQNMTIERADVTLHISIGNVAGLEQLPTLLGQMMGMQIVEMEMLEEQIEGLWPDAAEAIDD